MTQSNLGFPLKDMQEAERLALQRDVAMSRHGRIQDPEKVQRPETLGRLPLDIPKYTPQNMPDFTEQVMALTPVGGMIIGEKAVKRWAARTDKFKSKHAPRMEKMDLDLDRAKEMHNEGFTRDKIWDETGWYKDEAMTSDYASGKWKTEIPDEGAKLRKTSDNYYQYIEQGPNATVQSSVDHDLLKYLYDMDTVAMSNKIDDLMGEVSSVPIDSPLYPKRKQILKLSDDYDQEGMRSTLLHELQHVVQRKEGFNRGGTPEMFKPDRLAYAKTHLKNRIAFLEGLEKKGYSPDDVAIKTYRTKGGVTSWQMKDGKTITPKDIKMTPSAADNMGQLHFRAVNIPRLKKMYKRARLHSSNENVRHEHYSRVLGEIEARNVQIRDLMSAEERRATPPWKTMDRAEKDVINIEEVGSVGVVRSVLPPNASKLGKLEKLYAGPRSGMQTKEAGMTKWTKKKMKKIVDAEGERNRRAYDSGRMVRGTTYDDTSNRTIAGTIKREEISTLDQSNKTMEAMERQRRSMPFRLKQREKEIADFRPGWDR